MKKKILFIYINFTSFVKTDFEILSAKYNVQKYHFKPVKGVIKAAIELLKQCLFLSINFWRYDAIFIWFADYHSFIPVLLAKIFKKRSFIVIGGFDVARIQELNYGVFTSKLRGFFALYSMNHCSVNLTVSFYVNRKVKWIAKKAETKMIYNSVNLQLLDELKNCRENQIITVGLINNERTYYLKGIDTFIETARLLPEYSFTIIGIIKNKLENVLKELPINVNLVEPVMHEKLVEYYGISSIYCQFSRSESFGIAIAEAMSFGCIPIVTNVGGMPEVIGKTGCIAPREPIEIAKLIQDIRSLKTEVHLHS